MMITSFAAAVVAAVTGVAVIRTPGGNTQQIDVDAKYACEMAVAKLDENVNFFDSMKEVAKSSIFGGKKPTKYGQPQYTRREMEAVGELASAFDHVLGRLEFEPVEIRAYTTYNLDDNAGADPTDISVPEYALYTFVDDRGHEISFVDSSDERVLTLEFDATVYHVDTGLSQGPSNHCTGLFLDHLIEIGLDDLWWGRYYGRWAVLDDDLIGNNDLTVNNNTGVSQAMLSGFLGWLADHDPILFYRFYYGMWSIVDDPRFDETTSMNDLELAGTFMWGPNDDRWITCPLAGFLRKYWLNSSDELLGRETLVANTVKNDLHVAQNMNYNDVLQLNNLDVIY